MKDLKEKLNKKTLILIGGFLLLVIIIIFSGALLYNKLFYSVSYDKVETIMKDAAKEYLNDRKDELPSNNNESVTITEDDLVSTELMKSINELVKDENASCIGEVIVTNINGNYRYNPILDCGDTYKSVKFVDYIKENIQVTKTGNGLYELNNELVYRGDNVNNYLTFSNYTYRIVKFTNDYTVLILTKKFKSIEWDDRYNIDKNSNSGINNYNVSRIKDTLNNIYKETTLISDNDKLLVASHNVKIGKRNNKDTDKSGSLENSTILENQYLSLLPAYDFLNASIDTNCTNTTAKSCSNYNYLAKFNYSWWLSTATSNNTHQVYKVNDSINLSNASSSAYLRPVIYLTKDVVYISGDGTKENPYKVR